MHLKKVFPGIMETYVNKLPVIQTGALQVLVVDFEPKGANQMKRGLCCSTQTSN